MLLSKIKNSQKLALSYLTKSVQRDFWEERNLLAKVLEFSSIFSEKFRAVVGHQCCTTTKRDPGYTIGRPIRVPQNISGGKVRIFFGSFVRHLRNKTIHYHEARIILINYLKRI